MSIIDTLRPATVISAGGFASGTITAADGCSVVTDAGTIPAYLADDDDDTVVRKPGTGTLVVGMASHTPAAGYARHQIRSRSRYSYPTPRPSNTLTTKVLTAAGVEIVSAQGSGWSAAYGDGSTYEAAVAALNPIAWWKLDEVAGTTAVDSGSAGVNGTYVNTPTLGAAGPGVLSAVGFAAASSEYVSVGSLIGSNVAADWTVVAYTNRDSEGTQMVVVELSTFNGDTISYSLVFGVSTSVAIRYPINATAAGSRYWVVGSALGSWHHYALRFVAATKTFTLFRDGVNLGEQIASDLDLTVCTGTMKIRIGATASTDAGVGNWDGLLAQPAIYNSALSDGQVGNLLGSCAWFDVASAWANATPVTGAQVYQWSLARPSGSYHPRAVEVFVDVDTRAAPSFTLDVLDGDGVAADPLILSNIPTIGFTAVAQDGLPGRSWQAALYDLATTVLPGFVPFQGSGLLWSASSAGTAPATLPTTALPNGDYVAYAQIVTTVSTDTAYESDVESNAFAVALTIPAAPAVAVTVIGQTVQVCVTAASALWDSTIVFTITRYDDAHPEGVVVAVSESLPEQSEWCWTDCYIPLCAVTCDDDCTEHGFSYSATLTGLVGGYEVTTDPGNRVYAQYANFPGVNGHVAATYTTAPGQEFTYTERLRMLDWSPAAVMALGSQYGAAGNRGWAVIKSTAQGVFGVYQSYNGTLLNTHTFAAIAGLVDGTTDLWVRVVMDKYVTGGVATLRFRLYYSLDDENDETLVVFTLHDTVTTTSNPTLFLSTYAHKIGITATTDDDYFGRLYSASLRSGIPGEGQYLRTGYGANGAAISNYVTAITGEITATARAWLDDVTPATDMALCSQWGASGNRNYFVYVKTTGVVTLTGSLSGANAVNFNSTATLGSVGIADQTAVWIRVHHLPDNGSGSGVTKFYFSLDATNDESLVVWTQLGTTVTTVGGPFTRFASTYAHEAGRVYLADLPLSARLYSVSLRAGDPTAAIVWNPKFYLTPWAVGDVTGAARADAQGNTWTLAGDARIHSDNRLWGPRFYDSGEWTVDEDAGDTAIDLRGVTWTIVNDTKIVNDTTPVPAEELVVLSTGVHRIVSADCEITIPCLDGWGSWARVRPNQVWRPAIGGLPYVTVGAPGGRDWNLSFAVEAADLEALELLLASPVFYWSPPQGRGSWLSPLAETVDIKTSAGTAAVKVTCVEVSVPV